MNSNRIPNSRTTHRLIFFIPRNSTNPDQSGLHFYWGGAFDQIRVDSTKFDFIFAQGGGI